MCVVGAGTAAHFEDYLSRLWDVKYTFEYVVLTPSSHPIMDSGFGPSVLYQNLISAENCRHLYPVCAHVCVCACMLVSVFKL